MNLVKTPSSGLILETPVVVGRRRRGRCRPGSLAVDPELVCAQGQGENVAASCDQAVSGCVAIRSVDLINELFGTHALLLCDTEVLDEGHRPEVEEDRHDPQLEDAPDAQQEAAQAQLGPADPEHCRWSFF